MHRALASLPRPGSAAQPDEPRRHRLRRGCRSCPFFHRAKTTSLGADHAERHCGAAPCNGYRAASDPRGDTMRVRRRFPMSAVRFARGALACTLLLAAAIPAMAADAASPAPQVDHHQHLLSPQGATLLNLPKQVENLPAPIAALLLAQEAGWNDAARLAPLFSADAVMLDDDGGAWLQGPDAIAAQLSKRFARPYRVLPLAWRQHGDEGHLSALYSRGEGAERRNVGSVAMRFVRTGEGAAGWRIAMQYPIFPGPALEQPLDADRLVALLDAAGIRRAVVLSVAYWFQSPRFALADPDRMAREENAWTAAQVARHPQRLVAFCSLNPISDAALALLAECARDGRFKGLKLHFANSKVDLLDPQHVARVRAVFSAANDAGLAIVVHARDGDAYGTAQARVVVERLLPAAPDIDVQMAHLWGGAAIADDALAVYAEAVAAGHPATRRFVFDASDAGYAATTPAQAALLVRRMRQIGLDRIYYGSDGAFDGHPDPQASWQAFRKALPLTDAEFATIAANVAPYLRE